MQKLSLLFLIFFLGLLASCKKETTSTPDNTVKDIEGNSYATVTIGTQVWMAENLRTGKYNDGTVIPNVTDDAVWFGLSTGAWSNYDNNAANNAIYGKMYNWFAVNSGKLAPAGWHVPTDAEWTILTTYLGGVDSCQGKLKSTSSLWDAPNTGASNRSGFAGLPGGNRSYAGPFEWEGQVGAWWSSTAKDAGDSWARYLYNTVSNPIGWDAKRNGLSVRCIQD